MEKSIDEINNDLKVEIWKYYSYSGAKNTCEKFENSIIQCNCANLSLWFATIIEGANIKAHEKIVLESGDPEYNFLFATDVAGADIAAHRAVVFASDDDYFKGEFTKFMDELKNKKLKIKKLI